MTPLRQSITRLFSPEPRPLAAGSYQYQSPPEDPRNYRLHLRIEPDGSGVLIVNASTVLRLNQTATEYAYYLIQNRSADQVARAVSNRFNVSSEEARQDYLDLAARIQTLITTPDLDPVTFLDFERREPFSGYISAPYRLDCALTYGLPVTDVAEATPTDRVRRELSTDEWRQIFDKAYPAGVPHVVFTGGEPTLREDLPGLIEHAEKLGMVTGLITDGLRLADAVYLHSLLETGLDHLMLILHPETPGSWTALENCLAADVFVAVHLTLTETNLAEIPALLDRLASMGAHGVSLSAAEAGLADALQDARDWAANRDLELIWNLPVPYSARNPVSLETQTLEIPAGAGRAVLYVEPDGDVLPAQGINEVLGNLLTESWEKIWQASKAWAARAT